MSGVRGHSISVSSLRKNTHTHTHTMVRMSLLNYYFFRVCLLQMSIPKEKGKSPSDRELGEQIGPLLME